MALLHPGELYPHLKVNLVGGESLQVPESFLGNFAVVLFYRGSWCPYCNAQLRAFERAKASLDELGVKVLALSVDDEATTEKFRDKNGLTIALGHSGDADELSALTGAFVNDEPKFVQSTGFVLDPDGKILVSVYSSGAIGRLVPEDVAGFIRYVREHR